jgi:uncharacterized damage-inducible protein DinB
MFLRIHHPQVMGASMHSARRTLLWSAATLALPALLTFAALSAGVAQDTRATLRSELLGHFNTSIGKVIALAEAMPQERYGWKPHSEVMPVAQVYAHIARYNYYYPASSMGVQSPSDVRLDTLEAMRDKAQILQLLRHSADHVRRTIREIPAEQLEASTRLYGRTVPQWAVLFQLVAHMNEHLGQSIAYARSNDVVPPWSR